MANEYALNRQDASINPVAFALPAAASTSVSSAAIDLGADVFKPDTFELELSIPALSATIAPDTKTVTVIGELSTTSNFAAVAREFFRKVYTGASAAGIGASVNRGRVPSDAERYARWTITFGASTTDGSAVSATPSVRF